VLNLFKSDKAPYIFGILVTIIGWHVTQIGNEVTNTQAVTYRIDIDRQTGAVVATIRNVSRTKSLTKATFSLACPNGVDCLAPLRPLREGETAVYGEVRPVAPNATAAEPAPGNSAASMGITNTIAAGGQYEMVAQLTRPDSQLEFFFVPDESRPLDILLYRSNSITGFLVENYFRLVIISLVIFVGLLIASMMFNVRATRRLAVVVEGKTADPETSESRHLEEGDNG
jgi:hypothetical protein